MENAEYLYGLYLEQYFSHKYKAADIKSLNTCLLYYLIRKNRIPTTRTFYYLISN